MNMKLHKENDNILNLILLEMQSKIRKFEKQVIKDSGIKVTPKELNYLAIIDNQDHLKQNDIHNLLDVSKGTFSNIIKLLSKKGYVKQVRDEEDKRIKVLVITEKGQDLLKLNAEIRKRIRQHVLKKISKSEFEHIIELAMKLR